MAKKKNNEADELKDFRELFDAVSDDIGEYISPIIDRLVAEGLSNDEIDKRLETVKEDLIVRLAEKKLAKEMAERRIELLANFGAIVKLAVEKYFRREAIKDDPEYAKFIKEIEDEKEARRKAKPE
jgi:hypothetical protein